MTDMSFHGWRAPLLLRWTLHHSSHNTAIDYTKEWQTSSWRSTLVYQILYMFSFPVFGSTRKYQTLYQLSSNLCKMAQSVYVFKVVLLANLQNNETLFLPWKCKFSLTQILINSVVFQSPLHSSSVRPMEILGKLYVVEFRKGFSLSFMRIAKQMSWHESCNKHLFVLPQDLAQDPHNHFESLTQWTGLGL